MCAEKALGMLKQNKRLCIHAYEADSHEYKQLKKIDHHRLFVYYGAVCADDRREAFLYVPDGERSKGTLFPLTDAKRISVPAFHIDAVLHDHEKISTLQLNCEGAEIDILKHARVDLLARCKRILVEFHSFRLDLPATTDDVEDVVRRLSVAFVPTVIKPMHPVYSFRRKGKHASQ
jgi:FkbM family methyltransferase